MPANITFTRPTLNNADTLDATGFNAITALGGIVPDATPSAFGVIKLAGDLAGTADAPAIKESTLSTVMRDIVNKTTLADARTAFGLGDSATKNVGTTAGTVAAGDDSRMSNSRQCNGAFDNAATARTALGLGDSATKNTGTTAGTVAAGDDSRLSNSRQCNGAFDNAATARTALGIGSMALRALLSGTGGPSGGADGDVYFQYV